MTGYRFTRSAQEDLIDIWLYTQERWGEVQADSYQDALHLCCQRIAAGEAQSKPIAGLEWVRSHRCEHHYLFFVAQGSTVIVLAVLHERMNLMERLRDRL
ncbi:type II toxin-antitoxin system RelE/ParE family toxin [Marinibaculum pumilum]|uniref:Type II toxin-antitoxin system RelE/ParE family toxin n=1 Tax=Marinibaculum pumilum TaxID=1766165 RepID=A0ABV7L293_9PROT